MTQLTVESVWCSFKRRSRACRRLSLDVVDGKDLNVVVDRKSVDAEEMKAQQRWKQDADVVVAVMVAEAIDTQVEAVLLVMPMKQDALGRVQFDAGTLSQRPAAAHKER